MKWSDIEGYEGLYQVSDDGRIRSCDRYVVTKGGYNRICHGIEKKQRKDKDGYMKVSLHKDGNLQTFYVHRLVANAFIPNTENKPCVDHINAVRNDNRVENLRWFTVKENNSTDIAKTRKSVGAFKREDNKKKIIQYSLNGEMINKYNSSMDIERELGFEHSAVLRCCKGKQNTSYGYKWVYMD